MSFGKKLKMLRMSHNLDQNSMGQRLNVSQPVYSRFENDKIALEENNDFVRRVIEEFTVTQKWLMSDDNNSTILESGSISTSANGLGQIENYYNLPKDFMDAYFKQQQQMLEMILNKLGGVNLFKMLQILTR